MLLLLLFRRRYFALSGAAASPPRVTGCLVRRNPSFKCGRPAGWGECVLKKIALAVGDSPATVEGTVCGGWMEVKHFYPRFAVPSDSALRPLIGQSPGRSGGRGSSVIGRRQLPFLSGLTSRGQRVVSQAPCKLRTEVSRQVHNFFFHFINGSNYISDQMRTSAETEKHFSSSDWEIGKLDGVKCVDVDASGGGWLNILPDVRTRFK